MGRPQPRPQVGEPVSAFDPLIGERTRKAWLAAADMLRSGEFVNRVALVEAMLKGSDLKRNSCEQLLTSAMKAGWLYANAAHSIRVGDHGAAVRPELRSESQ